MTSMKTSVAHEKANDLVFSPNWEKEFFTTWLRLMERQKDEQDLTQTLQSLLKQDGDAMIIVQEAKHHANMMHANNKTMADLVAQLNEFFFRDIVPALHKLRQGVETMRYDRSMPLQQRQADPLDQYLEHGDEETVMPQAFVDNMSGWAAPFESIGSGQKKKMGHEKNMKQAEMLLYSSLQTGEEQGDGIAKNDKNLHYGSANDMYQKMPSVNSLKVDAMLNVDCSTMAAAYASQQQTAPMPNMIVPQGRPAGSKTKAHSSAVGRPKNQSSIFSNTKVMVDNGEVKNTHENVPSSTLGYLSSRSRSVSKSTSRTEPHSTSSLTKRRGCIGKKAASGLVADQVLDVRTYGTVKEYLICWQGLSAPRWIARQKSSPQAKELIDAYAAALRRRNAPLSRHGRGGSTSGRKRASRNGVNGQDGSGAEEVKFYVVDHIVNHRMHYNKRQYLVRWENYSASQDTWENAAKLRADVPDIVDAYEEKLQQDQTQTDAVHSTMSKTICDTTAASKLPTTRRSSESAEGAADGSTTQVLQSVNQVAEQETLEKRQHISTDDEGKQDGVTEDITSKDDSHVDVKDESWKNVATKRLRTI